MRSTALPLAAQARLSTPLGPVTLAATKRGLAGLWFDGQRHHPGPLEAPLDPDQRWIAAAREQLAAYWQGRMPLRFAVPLDLQGTPFQQRVWAALLQVTPGRTCSYSELAQAAGLPAAVRAVGAAIGRNPVSIIVPCHRIIGRDGSLTGYAGGLQRKQSLLHLEGVGPPTAPPA
jgi:methylated-DNA-[protein]-cysteine S-methyltransferase